MSNHMQLLPKTIKARQLINKNSNLKFIVILDSTTAYPTLTYNFEKEQRRNCKFWIKSRAIYDD